MPDVDYKPPTTAEILAALAADAELEWQREIGSRIWTVANPMLPGFGADNVVWEPPNTGKLVWVRNWRGWADAADPFVAAGGATTVSVGTRNAVVRFAPGTALASWLARPYPQINSPSIDGANYELVGRAGAFPGAPALDQRMWAVCDVGSVSGTLRYSFEWRYAT